MEKLYNTLKSQGTMRIMRKGTNVLFQGEIPRHALIVRDGVIRAYTIASTGEERIVALYGRGDIFPLPWLLGEVSNTLFYYDALSEARLMSVSKPAFNTAVMENAELLRELLHFIGSEYTALLLRITGLEQSRAIEKIGFTLYYLLFRYGTSKADGLYQVDIKISQLMLASLVGLTRESTAKNLKVLKDKKIIAYYKSTYTIHKTKLENFLGEDGFRDLTL